MSYYTGPPGQQSPVWPGYYRARPQPVSGLAIASMVLGIIWLAWLGSLLAVIFGHVALRRIRRSGQRGSGMAVAGLVLGYIGVATAVLAIVIAAANSGNSNPSAATGSSTKQPAAASNRSAAPAPACTTWTPINSRAWADIAKDPDGHRGQCVIVYGQVTQFDSATGTDTFRADIGGTYQAPSDGFVDYQTNTILTGNSARLNDLVQGDLFTAKVHVAGSVSYDNQMGGGTTAPKLQVDSVKVTGHLSS